MGSVSDFFDVLEYDTPQIPVKSSTNIAMKPLEVYTQQIVLASGDLEGAVDALHSTLNDRTACAIRSVQVQESAIARFNTILKRRIPTAKFNLTGFEYEGVFIALDTFRTAKEALTLVPIKQSHPLSIWSQDISTVIEMAYKAASVGRLQIWINSIGIHSSQFPIYVISSDVPDENKNTSLVIDKQIQYQRISLKEGVWTTIVTPFGNIFAN